MHDTIGLGLLNGHQRLGLKLTKTVYIYSHTHTHTHTVEGYVKQPKYL